VTFEFINKPEEDTYCKPWLKVNPSTAVIEPGKYITYLIVFLCSSKNFGGAYSRHLVRPSVCQSVRTSHSCPAHNFVIWSLISKLFYRNDHHVETTCCAEHLGTYLEGQGHSMTLQQNRVRPITLLFEVGFRKYFTEMVTILRQRVSQKFGSLPWRSRSQHDLAAKSCPANNFVIWSQISKIFNRNDHHIETKCRIQHLGCYF